MGKQGSAKRRIEVLSPGSCLSPWELGRSLPQGHDHPELLLGGPRGQKAPAGEKPRVKGAGDPLLELG